MAAFFRPMPSNAVSRSITSEALEPSLHTADASPPYSDSSRAAVEESHRGSVSLNRWRTGRSANAARTAALSVASRSRSRCPSRPLRR